MKPLMTRDGKGDVRFSADLAKAPATCMGECICARAATIYRTESRGCREHKKVGHFRNYCVPLMGLQLGYHVESLPAQRVFPI